MPDMGHQHVITAMESFGIDASVTSGTSVALGNQTKGGYTELIAATTFDYAAVVLEILSPSSLERHVLDVAIGAGGVEQIILPDYLSGGASGDVSRVFRLPIGIPAGSRIAVAGESSLAAGTNTIRVMGHGIAANPRLPSPQASRAIAYGVTVGTTANGTNVDPGGTANTKGAWAPIAASTSADHHGLIVGFSTNNNGTTTGTTLATTMNWLVDIGIGAGGAEVVLIPNIPIRYISTRFGWAGVLTYEVAIPSGTRLSARAACGVNTAVERIIDIALYGLT